jgi:hypothetical protein
MQIEVLKPDRLRLNPDNDRHGPLKDEASAIHWLLENRNSHMRALAEDLAISKRLYEAPWPAPGSEDTELGCFDGTGGESWREDGLRESSSLRLYV